MDISALVIAVNMLSYTIMNGAVPPTSAQEFVDKFNAQTEEALSKEEAEVVSVFNASLLEKSEEEFNNLLVKGALELQMLALMNFKTKATH